MSSFKMSSSLILLLFGGILYVAGDCPKPCTCEANKVDCRGRNLIHVPSLPDDSEIVDLSNNKISEILEADFQNQTKLKSLNLTSNLIKNISSECFKNSTVFSHLYLGDNRLIRIPDLKVKSLESVDFSGNSISEHPFEPFGKSWFESVNLTTVSVARNKFKHFTSTTFNNLKAVKILDLSSNHELISIDPSVFRHVGAKLTTLDLSSNSLPLQPLADAFGFLEALTELNLNGNKLTNLDGVIFKSMAHLETLSLSGNGLATWSANAFSHFKLKTLDLSNNQIQSIQNTSYNSIDHIEKTLKTVQLSGNPFSCYCSLIWLRTWVDSKSVNVTDKSKMKCDQPEAMKNKPFLSLHVSNCTSDTTTPSPPSTTTTLPPTTTEPNTNTTTTAIPTTTHTSNTTTSPHVTTTTANSTAGPTTPNLMTTTANSTPNMTTTETTITTTHSIVPTTPSHSKKAGIHWWGVLLILLLLAVLAAGAYFMYKRWRRRRLLDEGRLPIIGDQTA